MIIGDYRIERISYDLQYYLFIMNSCNVFLPFDHRILLL